LTISGAAGFPLATNNWESVITQAAELGVLQCSFSGGEPLLFRDLAILVGLARKEGLYTNLITSAVGLNAARAAELKEAGLDNVQISFQADSALLGDAIAGARVHELKLAAAKVVREAGLNLSMNVVMHRFSVDLMPEMAELAYSLGATRIELAHVQFYGWAFENRRLLLPTREQMTRADEAIPNIKEKYKGAMEVLYVKSDYFDARPKACMGGWGSRFMTVDPEGFVLPCPTARSIPEMAFANVGEAQLKWIWEESEAFQKFRGFDWMQEPCRSCEFKTVDFGGCRCQAALLTGEAASTDPVCGFSPNRNKLDAMLREVAVGELGELAFRIAPARVS
jgi:pyrroloquinoline quinone biosynthesis protein E